jgi:hypothetical protein
MKSLVSATPPWLPHAIDGWYLGPALKHYRCYGVTASEGIADTTAVIWLPSKVSMPTASSTDGATFAATQNTLAKPSIFHHQLPRSLSSVITTMQEDFNN